MQQSDENNLRLTVSYTRQTLTNPLQKIKSFLFFFKNVPSHSLVTPFIIQGDVLCAAILQHLNIEALQLA